VTAKRPKSSGGKSSGPGFWIAAKTGVHCAANIDAVVAVGAALIDEKLQALLLFFREGSVVAFEPTVEGCVGRDQRRLENRDRPSDIAHRQSDRLQVGNALFEGFDIAGYGFKLFDGMLFLMFISAGLKIVGPPRVLRRAAGNAMTDLTT